MFECKATIHDREHLIFPAKPVNANAATPTTPATPTGRAFNVFVVLASDALKFYSSSTKETELFALNPVRMNADNDKNSHRLTITFANEDNPTLEIVGNVEALDHIETFITKRAKVNYKGSLMYTPANRTRETIFTTGEFATNLRGFLNLALLTLLFAKFRDILKNFLSYGVILTMSLELTVTFNEVLCYIGSLLIPVFITFWAEKLGFQNRLPQRLVDFIATVNIFGLLIIPSIMCHMFKPAPLPGMFYTAIAISLIMKLYSYSDVMNNLRKTVPRIVQLEKENKDVVGTIGEHEISRENLEIILKHKNNISELANLRDLSYFLVVPTFCFQLWYPRNQKIRKVYLFKRLLEAGMCWALFAFVTNQYTIPIMIELAQIDDKLSFEFLEKFIRLSFPVQVSWILFFFGTFQYAFNINAELTRFADRNFYKDWWNCRDLNEYWRLWNLPIHNFFTRHVYFPMLKKGYTKTQATLWVFLLSALGHEYWASVPLRLIAPWAFLSMMIQAPIMIAQKATDKFLKGSQLGNYFFWISFCFVGQPMALLLYYESFMKVHGDGTK